MYALQADADERLLTVFILYCQFTNTDTQCSVIIETVLVIKRAILQLAGHDDDGRGHEP
jgi:hypothetical protein